MFIWQSAHAQRIHTMTLNATVHFKNGEREEKKIRENQMAKNENVY